MELFWIKRRWKNDLLDKRLEGHQEAKIMQLSMPVIMKKRQPKLHYPKLITINLLTPQMSQSVSLLTNFTEYSQVQKGAL